MLETRRKATQKLFHVVVFYSHIISAEASSLKKKEKKLISSEKFNNVILRAIDNILIYFLYDKSFLFVMFRMREMVYLRKIIFL